MGDNIRALYFSFSLSFRPNWFSTIMEISLMCDSASGYVVPKETCEHLEENALISSIDSVTQTCGQCGTGEEIWICMACGGAFCGRFVNRHMVDHSLDKMHLVALSLSDLSFWCYVCDAYVIHTNPKLLPVYRAAHLLKFNC